MTIEIILPTGQRIRYTPKSSARVGSLAKTLAKKHGLAQARGKRGIHWQLRGPTGPIHPSLTLTNVDLQVGECLKLEEKL